MLNSKVHLLQSQIKQSEENHKNEVRGLSAEKTSLKQQITSSTKEKIDANNKCMELKAQLVEVEKSLEKKTEDNKQLQSKVSALEKDILEVKKKSDVDLFAQLSHDIESLETNLRKQEKYTCTADVQFLIDQVNEVSRRIISDIEIKHGLEKEVIRLDLKNKGEIVLALQKQVHDLKAMNHLLNEALKSELKKEAVKSELKKDQPTDYLEDLRPDTEEVLKRLAAMRKERRNGDGSSDNTHLTCSPMWGWQRKDGLK